MTLRTSSLLLTAILLAALVSSPPTASPLQGSDRSPPRPVRYSWPLAPPHPVLRPFQPPATTYGPGHRGVDLGAPADAPVLAAGDGTVAFAGPVGGRGVVSIAHQGGVRTTYEPVHPLVATGQPVARGTPIATLAPGHDGCVDAVCLHWGARRGVEYLDPLGLLASGRVRLLPWDGQASVFSRSLARNRSTARVWSWQTRDSVTPRTRPISARVRFSK